MEKEATRRPEVRQLMTHPGVGSLAALAFVLIESTVSSWFRSFFICRDVVAKTRGRALGVISANLQ